MTHGVAATKGHCAGNGGLRGHSVGGVFPCVIFAQGNIHAGPPSWYFRAPNGVNHGPYQDYDEAFAKAGKWLDNRPVSFEPETGFGEG